MIDDITAVVNVVTAVKFERKDAVQGMRGCVRM
jgi:hypothetical protein